MHAIKELRHICFRDDYDLEIWVNKNLDPEQLINISQSQSGSDYLLIVWYWDIKYRDEE